MGLRDASIARGLRYPSSSVPISSRRCASSKLDRLSWFERRVYTLACNWKVFVDNYLDGGYHVPHLHKALDSVLDYSSYTIENGARFCLQSSPLVTEGAEQATASVRTGRPRTLLLDLSQRDDQQLRGGDGYESGHSARSGPRPTSSSTSISRTSRTRPARATARASTSASAFRTRTSPSASRCSVASARAPTGGTAVGAPRGGRASVPPPAVRRSRARHRQCSCTASRTGNALIRSQTPRSLTNVSSTTRLAGGLFHRALPLV